MLTELFQKSHELHRALPLLGPVLDDFDDWLVAQGYRHSTRECYLLRCTAIEKYFQKRRQRTVSSLSLEQLDACWHFYRHRPGAITNVVTCLQRFLQERNLLSKPCPPATPFSEILDAYRAYLTEVRGLAASTIDQHCTTTAEFLKHASEEDSAFRLATLTKNHIEAFIGAVHGRFNRPSLQHVIAHVRGFLRFLAMHGEVPANIDLEIDTPRVYRLEQLPRSLPWDVVRAFLDSIDRTHAAGLRDYAIFLLVATYGLRGCDIASLELSDINWRRAEICLCQSKTRHPLLLPLTDPVGDALLAYLHDGRPQSVHRQIFLSAHAPIRPLTRQSAGYAFRFRVARSGLDIPFRGVHCLRHSLAMHLLRQGVALKCIGDLLGHRSAESTGVYLRLDLDDLRGVALPLPSMPSRQVQP
jgi:site-specific recombinase XerD